MSHTTRVGDAIARFAVLGAHGGAGTTTVTRFLDPDGRAGSLELARGIPLPTGYTPVVVSRSTASGMKDAARLMGAWHPQLPPPWLVIVQDAPLPLPKPVVFRRRTLEHRLAGVAEVPYLVQLRSVDEPRDALTHRAVQRAAHQLRLRLGLPE